MAKCPCGSRADLDDCCGPIIAGDVSAPTAEALMRSRYTAFTRADMAYVESTQIQDEDDESDSAANENEMNEVEWVGLEIFKTADGGEDDDTGMVEFAAQFKRDGVLGVHRERSSFRREDGNWIYVDGETNLKGDPVRVKKSAATSPAPAGPARNTRNAVARDGVVCRLKPVRTFQV